MELTTAFKEYGKKILCTIILEKIAIWPFKRFKTDLRRVLASCTIFLLFEIIQILFLLITQNQIMPVFFLTLITSFIASLAIYVVSWCYLYTNNQFEKALRISTHNKDIESRFIKWLKRITNIWYQLLTSIILSILVILIIYLIKNKISITFKFEIFHIIVGVILVVFWMGQGAYWAVVTPSMTRELRRCRISDIGINPIFPSKTPSLIAISRVLSVYAIWDAIMVTLCIIGLFIARPDFNKGGIYYLLMLVLIGYYFLDISISTIFSSSNSTTCKMRNIISDTS